MTNDTHTHTPQKSRQLIVIGAGGQASNIINVAYALHYSIKAFIHNGKAGNTLFDKPIFADLSEIDSLTEYDLCLALGDNYQREKYLTEACQDQCLPPITVVNSVFDCGKVKKLGSLL